MVKDMNRQNSSISNSNKVSVASVLIKAFALFVILLCVFFLFVSPEYTGEYTGSILDKVDRMNSIKEPKIILCGDSNVAFGFRSDMIEESLNMPVVNAGLHGALGHEFHERLALLNVNKGDIVIECPTYLGWDESTKGFDYVVAWVTIENHLDLWKYIPMKYWGKMIYAFPTYMKKCINLKMQGIGNLVDEDTSYSRKAFNEYGDDVYAAKDLGVFYEFPDDFTPAVPWVNKQGMERFLKVKKQVENRGGKYYIAPYPIACNDSEADALDFNKFNDKIKDGLDGVVVGDYKDYVYPYSYFYNTEYHLTEEGAQLRTQQLIDDLKIIIETNNGK